MPKPRQERRYKPGKDIQPLSLVEFDTLRALIRIKVDALTPVVISNMQISTLKDPSRFDKTIADVLIKEEWPIEVPSRAQIAQAVAWYRHAVRRDPKPDFPPPAFFLKSNADVTVDDPERETRAQVMKLVTDTTEAHRKDIMREMKPTDFKDPEVIDDQIKDLILREKGCLESVTALSKERPSVFDILASSYRYHPDKIEIQRNILRGVRSGEMSDQQGYYECFKQTHPNSKRIIRDLQRDAALHQSSAPQVNLE